MTLLAAILTSSVIALLSIVGILFVRSFNGRFEKFLISLVALSAGAMLGNAMFHLFPEALESGEEAGISVMTIMGVMTAAFVASFLFEQFFRWHHCHSGSHHGKDHPTYHCDIDTKPVAHLILISDGLHNLIDGLIIGASFVVSPVLGLSTAAAIALHEIPQEIGDFAVLVHGGMKVKRALLLNFLSASTVVIGTALGFILSASLTTVIPLLLPFAAGSFLYIAAADLLPELKHDEESGETALHTTVFLFGLALMIAFSLME